VARRGVLFVMTGPSGVGKGTIRAEIQRRIPDLYHSVSVTSRRPRPGERDGVDYRFFSEHEIRRLIEAGDLLEWAEYIGDLYGTPRRPVEDRLAKGIDVLLEIDYQGARSVERVDSEAVLIFIAAPSLTELERRLRARKSETPERIERRMTRAREECKGARFFQYCVVNDNLGTAARDVEAIIRAERARTRLLTEEDLQAFCR
jgi:guanylate kinase